MDLIITILPVVTKDLPIFPRFTPNDFLSRCEFSTLTTRQPMVEYLDRTSEKKTGRDSVCVCVAIPFILDVRLVDGTAGVTQEEGHTGFLRLPSVVLALIFLARRIQSFLSLVDREIELCVLTN